MEGKRNRAPLPRPDRSNGRYSQFLQRLFATLLCALLLAIPVSARESATTPAAEGTAESGDTAEISRLESMRRSDPEDLTNRLRLGELLLKAERPDEALTVYTEALQIRPRSHEARSGKGIALARTGELQAAEETLREALVLHPNPVRTHYELGRVYERLGAMEKAIAQYRKGLEKLREGRR